MKALQTSRKILELFNNCFIKECDEDNYIPREMKLNIDDINLNILYGIKWWYKSISFDIKNIDIVKKVIQNISNKYNYKINGYFIKYDDNTIIYIYTRYPRRTNEYVNDISIYENIFENIINNLRQIQFTQSNIDLKQSDIIDVDTTTFRVLIGCDEGYLEGKKNQILKKIELNEFKSREELVNTICSELGHDILNDDDKNIYDVLKNKKLSIKHTDVEAQEYLGDLFQIEKCEIYAITPNNSVYEEDGIVIYCMPTQTNFNNIIQLAKLWKQHRITIENMSRKNIINVELLNFC